MRLEEARNAVEASARLGGAPSTGFRILLEALSAHGFLPGEIDALWWRLEPGEKRTWEILKFCLWDVWRKVRVDSESNYHQLDRYRTLRDLAALSLLVAEVERVEAAVGGS